MEQWTGSKLGKKKVHQGCVLSSCLFNLYAVYNMRNTVLDNSQAVIKIVMRNINNLRYTDNTTLMAESEVELKRLLMRVKRGGWKSWLETHIKKLRLWHLVPSLHGKYRGESGSSDRFHILGLQNHCGW